MLFVKAKYYDGDTITTRFNGTTQEALKHYMPRSVHNVGLGPYDCWKLLVGVVILREGGNTD